MSWLCDTAELVPSGWLSSAYPGHGVRGGLVPSDGLNGPSFLYPGLSLPADEFKEIRAYISRWPSGVFTPGENGQFGYVGSNDYALYQWYTDGVLSSVDLGYGAGVGRVSFGALVISHPGGDVTIAGWTSSTGGALFSCIDELSAADTSDFITSPQLNAPQPAVFTLTAVIPAGACVVNINAKYVASSGSVRVVLLDNAGASVGASAWQVLSSSFSTYALSVTISAIASRVQLEVTS